MSALMNISADDLARALTRALEDERAAIEHYPDGRFLGEAGIAQRHHFVGTFDGLVLDREQDGAVRMMPSAPDAANARIAERVIAELRSQAVVRGTLSSR